MNAIIFSIVAAFVIGFLIGEGYGIRRCTKIMLHSPAVRELLGEQQWNAFMRRFL